MKKLTMFLVALVIATAALAGQGKGEKSTLEVDTKGSKVYWTAAKVTGEHTGYVAIESGEVHVEDNAIVGAHVKMDMSSIQCTDLEGEWKDKLVGHLKSDDFFSVEKHPSASFSITSIKDNKVVGELTIKGISHEISFPADLTVEGSMVKAAGSVSVDRTLYDIRYRSGKFFSDLGDRMIDDKFEIRFELLARAQSTL